MSIIDKILIADDEFLIRQFLEETVVRQGIESISAIDANEAISALQDNDIQLAFIDLKLGRTSGIDVLEFIQKNKPDVIAVIMTAYGTIETAVQAMKLGAFDFIIKPFSPDQATIIISKAKKWLQLSEQNNYLQREVVSKVNSGKIIGDSPKIKSILKLIERVAPTTATVLITGESGTGKELAAAEVHRLFDPSGKKPYIRMNCAAVPEALLESELFGHEKGAFTGASERRIGRFELADTGTLLLDEIGEISNEMQSKLLRVLQESEFERVGGTKTIKVNVRVMATTNRNLKEEVDKGNFREDLYYRLNVFPISMPPLRERSEDSVRIAKVLLERQELKLRRPLSFDDSALEAIRQYAWPGNIRELQNVIERVSILEDGPIIQKTGLPSDILADLNLKGHCVNCADSTQLADIYNIDQIELITINRALEKTQGNRTKAAELLGITSRTLRNKLSQKEV